jgi:hypothetical protein
MLALEKGDGNVIWAYLESVLPRKALVTVVAREGLDSQMNSLVSLQVMIAIEALWTLITLEWPVVRSRLLMGRVAEKMRHGRCMAAVEPWYHAGVHTNQSKAAVRVLDIRIDRCGSCLIC